MGDYENSEQRPDARLIILKALAAQTNESLHSGYLVKELLRLGIDKDRAWVHGEMEWLSEMGAVKLTRAETVMIATLTEKGARHLRRSIVIEGVSRPSRPGA